MSKNTRNRILLTALAALLLVTLTIGGTMAWLTATSEAVTNTFTTSEIKIELWEHQLSSDGIHLDSPEPGETIANEGYKLIPGETLEKDPFVRVTEGPCYIFVTVTNTAYNYVSYEMADGWVEVARDDEKHTVTYGYTKDGVMSSVATGAEVYCLDGNEITVKTSITNETMAQYNKEQHALTFTACALQAKNLTAGTAEAMWALYKDPDGITE